MSWVSSSYAPCGLKATRSGRPEPVSEKKVGVAARRKGRQTHREQSSGGDATRGEELVRLALIADLHLGSRAIGDGRWKQQIIKEVVVPQLKELNPTHLIFLGDTLDFKQGVSSMTAERPNLVAFVAEQFGILSLPSYILVGNHDDWDSCQFLEKMPGGPTIVTDD